MGAALFKQISVVRDSRPHLCIRDIKGKLEVGRQHAYDSVGFGVERQALPDYGGGASEAALPQPVAEDNYALCATLVFFGSEGAPFYRLDSEQGEEVCRHAPTNYSLGLSDARERVAHRAKDRHLFKRLVLLLPIDNVEESRRAAAPERIAFMRQDDGEPVGVFVRERAQQHGVYHAKDRRVRAYAK